MFASFMRGFESMDLGLWDIILDITNYLADHRSFACRIFSRDKLQRSHELWNNAFIFLRPWDFCTYREVLFG